MNKDEILKGPAQQRETLSAEDKNLINKEVGNLTNKTITITHEITPLTPQQIREQFSGIPNSEIINHGQGMTQAYKDAATSIAKELGLTFVEKDETVKNISQIREDSSENSHDLEKSTNPTLK
jgi:hypothetical protein